MKIALVLLIVVAAEGAYEGDSCFKGGVPGVCTDLKACPAALDDIKNRRPTQNCGFGAVDPIVCCIPTPGRQPTLTTTKRPATAPSQDYPEYDYVDLTNRAKGSKCAPIPPTLTSNSTGQKAWDKCIEYQERLVFPCEKSTALAGGHTRVNRCYHNADELIIGGEAAAAKEFPHMALLGYTDESSNLHWLCGGTLISENFVLTAGHCISSKERWNVTHVQLSTLRRSAMSPRNRYRVKNIIKHPQYASPKKYNDIALLELETSAPLSDLLVPACLHTGGPVDDSRATVTGWGLTSNNGKDSDPLQKVILTKFSTAECVAKYRPGLRHMKQGFLETSQICFGDRTMSKDTCNGDSGGPLQIKNKQIACMYTVVGVTSLGDECGFVGVPGIYTRVAHYLPWIESTVWP